jgi:hypothetical protein
VATSRIADPREGARQPTSVGRHCQALPLALTLEGPKKASIAGFDFAGGNRSANLAGDLFV